MRIAVIAPTQIPARRANTIQVMKMTQAIAQLGHQVRLAVPGGEAVPWERLAHQYGLHRHFPVEWLPVRPRWRRYDYGWRTIRWARQWGAELLYTRLPQAAALASMASVPVVYEIHDWPQGSLGPLLFRLFLRGRGARGLVVITEALLRDLRASFSIPEGRLHVIVAPDGVDLERYAELPATAAAREELRRLAGLTLGEKWFIAGYSGHFYAGRGVELLFELATRLPDIHFLLMGGEQSDLIRLQKSVDARRLRNVHLTGFVPNAELPGYQAACDVLLMPYQRQVAASSGGDIAAYLSPMKLFEYLACGRPIISSDLPVLREVLSPDNAILIPGNKPESWAQVLRDIQTSPQKYREIASRARQDAQGYTWEARARKIFDVV